MTTNLGPNTEPNLEPNLEKFTKAKLIELCDKLNIKGYKSQTKAKLIVLIKQTQQPKTNEVNIKYTVSDTIDYLKQDTQNYTCIYLDPPYSSGRDYKFAESDREIAFTDKFNPDEYRSWLNQLVTLCKARLTENGTLWFHISADYSFIAEQVLYDHFKQIEKNFWKKSHGKNTVKNRTGSVIDIIFRCYNVKSIFNLQYIPLDAHYFETSYKNQDSKGLYALGSLRFDKTRSGNKYAITINGVEYKSEYGWKIKQPELERLIEEERIHFVQPTRTRQANLYKKLYKHECKGKPLSNLWDDISYITRTQEDPRVYPTQKPLKLLERIISISTNENDWVLDPTAGSGTTGVACKKNNRNCCMIDINPQAKECFITRNV
jgi:adenine-specific DNA-methyltransferase